MPLPLPRSAGTRMRALAGASILAVVLFAGIKLFSPGRGAEAPVTAPSSDVQSDSAGSATPGGMSPVPDLRLVFSIEELPGKADVAGAGALVLGDMGDGHSGLLVWSAAGIQLYADASTPLEMPALQLFKGVRDVKAADFNNDGLTDLCVIAGHRATLLMNGPHGFTLLDGGVFPGEYTQALWLDYDHDGALDLILLGRHPLLLRNRDGAHFTLERTAMPFLPGEALAATVIREPSTPGTADFIVSYRNRAGVRYRDRSGGKYGAEELPELPAGATQLHSGEFTNHGKEDFSYLLGGNATLVEFSGDSWAPVMTVPAGPAYLFGDFTNLGVQDWMAGGLLLAGGDGNFAQSRDMVTAPANSALVASDFDRDGKLDFAGVASDGTILRCMNRSDLASHWLRIRLSAKPGRPTLQGSLITLQTPGATQHFFYEGIPLHIGIGAYESARRIGILWPGGASRTDSNLPADASYTYDESPKTLSSVESSAPPITAPYLTAPLDFLVAGFEEGGICLNSGRIEKAGPGRSAYKERGGGSRAAHSQSGVHFARAFSHSSRRWRSEASRAEFSRSGARFRVS